MHVPDRHGSSCLLALRSHSMSEFLYVYRKLIYALKQLPISCPVYATSGMAAIRLCWSRHQRREPYAKMLVC